ncbi:MAG: alpha/beta hydrolase [Saprospiraceae bacterium]|nr:alpha/beta hydrolase [Saprospiraceae bacterium]
MKVFLKILKWIGLLIGSILILIIFAALVFRLFDSKPPAPGELVDIGEFKLHLHAEGDRNNKPTLVIEGGLGVPSDHYHWLSAALKDSMRVVRYDRAGIVYSDASQTPRDAETVARELHTLLEKAGESPPYILAGHSMGGLFIRVFTELYPDEVAALVFVDSSHPDFRERLNLPPRPSSKRLLSTLAIVADLGVLTLFDHAFGPLLAGQGLPEEVNDRALGYTYNGKYLRAVLRENQASDLVFERAKTANNFGALPIRVFAANERQVQAYHRYGIDPDWATAETMKMQQELADLSSAGQLMTINGNHNSIYTKKENAAIICQEILHLLEEVQTKP